MDNFFEPTFKNLLSHWKEEVRDLDPKDPDEWRYLDCDLIATQYGYIKFGFLIEKIRNTRMWERCGERFTSFKDFCLRRLRLEIWQVNATIKAATIASHLIAQGFEVIPTNCAQAAELVDAYDREEGYYGERPALTSVWEQIVEKFAPAKITAATIKSIADPNFEEKQSQKISKGTAKILAARAKKEGKTVDDLVHELLREREEHDCEGESVPDTGSLQEQAVGQMT